VNKGISVDARVVDGVISVTMPDGQTKEYQVGSQGASVQNLWLCGSLEGFVLKSINAQA